jgi:hypothetical protein
MQFNVDNESYEGFASDSILANAESGELWVFHDPGYEPSGNWTQEIHEAAPNEPPKEEFFTAASDSLNWWLP